MGRYTISLFSGFTGSVFLLKSALHILAPTFLWFSMHLTFLLSAGWLERIKVQHASITSWLQFHFQSLSLASSRALFPLSLGLCKLRDTLLLISYPSSGSLIFNLCVHLSNSICFLFVKNHPICCFLACL